jgi:F-type H+-transporting ATPase subunit a
MADHHDPNAFHHVMDSKTTWELFDRFFGDPVEIRLPYLGAFFGHDVYLTKYMLLELLVAALVLAIFIPICRRVGRGELPKGAWWNAFESLLTFIRDEVAKPAIGEHEADKYVPFLWTMFVFILFCNLLGMIPFLGSPTASIYVTGSLAVCSFIMMHGPAMAKMGPVSYFKALWPHIEIVPYPWDGPDHSHGNHEGHAGHDPVSAHAPHSEEARPRPTAGQILTWILGASFGYVLSLMIFTIELAGTVIKAIILAVRLFANMFAGHLVLAMILLFIYQVGVVGGYLLWGTVTFSSVIGIVALSLLELFVAFLQAYVFTFLTALFMGMALHPEH